MTLPINNHRHQLACSGLGPSYGIIARYAVSSSDVVGEPLRINVTEEGTGQLVWLQERSLSESEIIEVLKPAGQEHILWSTHKPIKGWYIRFRSPVLPPGFSIPLVPYKSQPRTANNPFSTLEIPDGSMTFTCRTQADMSRFAVPPTEANQQNAAVPITEHSYPPAPSPVISPRGSISASSVSSSSRLDDTLSPSTRLFPTLGPLNARPSSQITHFLASPYLPPADGSHHVQSSSSKIFGALQKVFTGGAGMSFSIQAPSLPPLLRFHDTTPVLSVRTAGIIELDEGVARVLGVDPSFYIAVALAFLEFLSDKEAYLAASEG